MVDKPSPGLVLEEKRWWLWLVDTILEAQPLLAAPIFLSVLLGSPPLWLSWLVAVTPLALRFWRHGHLARRTPFDIPILLLTLGLLVGLAVSPNQAVSLEALNTFLACILIYYGIVSNSYAKNSYWLLVAAIICLIVLGLSIWFFLEGEQRLLPFNEWVFKLAEPFPKTNGPLLNLHSLAAVLAVIVPALFSIALFKGVTRLRLVGLALGLGFLAILFLTASGSGWIAAAIGLVLVVLCWRLWLAGPVLATLGLIAWLATSSYDKVSWMAQVFSVDSFLSRVDYWRGTIDLLAEHPISGLGLGTWFEVYNNYNGLGTIINPHNSYLQLYSDSGLLGLVAMIWAAVVFLSLSRRILFSSRHGAWYGVTVGIIGGIVAGATQAIVEVTTTGTITESATTYHYIAIPLLWILGALFIVAYNHLDTGNQKHS